MCTLISMNKSVQFKVQQVSQNERSPDSSHLLFTVDQGRWVALTGAYWSISRLSFKTEKQHALVFWLCWSDGLINCPWVMSSELPPKEAAQMWCCTEVTIYRPQKRHHSVKCVQNAFVLLFDPFRATVQRKHTPNPCHFTCIRWRKCDYVLICPHTVCLQLQNLPFTGQSESFSVK